VLNFLFSALFPLVPTKSLLSTPCHLLRADRHRDLFDVHPVYYNLCQPHRLKPLWHLETFASWLSFSELQIWLFSGGMLVSFLLTHKPTRHSIWTVCYIWFLYSSLIAEVLEWGDFGRCSIYRIEVIRLLKGWIGDILDPYRSFKAVSEVAEWPSKEEVREILTSGVLERR